jgi:hypothetical protein
VVIISAEHGPYWMMVGKYLLQGQHLEQTFISISHHIWILLEEIQKGVGEKTNCQKEPISAAQASRGKGEVPFKEGYQGKTARKAKKKRKRKKPTCYLKKNKLIK